MKRRICLLLAVLSVIVLQAQQVKRIQLPVISATVFTSGAQMNMSGKVALPAGKMKIWVDGISRDMVSETLQCTATGNVQILSIIQESDTTGGMYAGEIKRRMKKLEELKDSTTLYMIHMEVLRCEKEMLLQNTKIGGSNGVKATDLKQLADFVSTRLAELGTQLFKYEKEVKHLADNRSEIEQQLYKLREQQSQISEGVCLLVESKESVNTVLSISYMVSHAGWYPSYDLRLPEEKGDAILCYRAKVGQNTGIDWKNVSLVLSSGNPQAVREVPVIYPYYLRNMPRLSNTMPNVSNMAIQRKLVAEVQEMSMDTEESAPVGMTSLAEQSESMNNVNYTIRIPYTIPGDSKESEVQISESQVKVTYEYIVIPRMSQEALLVVGIPEFSSYNLQDGHVSLYLGNSYRGTQMIQRGSVSPINDILSLSMGADKDIVVKRVAKQNYRKVTGSMVREEKLWETTIRNNKTIPVKVKVEDQYPLSQDDKIKVEELIYTQEGAEVDSTTGKLTWTITIQPKATVSLNVGYTVKYPKDWNIFVR